MIYSIDSNTDILYAFDSVHDMRTAREQVETLARVPWQVARGAYDLARPTNEVVGVVEGMPHALFAYRKERRDFE